MIDKFEGTLEIITYKQELIFLMSSNYETIFLMAFIVSSPVSSIELYEITKMFLIRFDFLYIRSIKNALIIS